MLAGPTLLREIFPWSKNRGERGLVSRVKIVFLALQEGPGSWEVVCLFGTDQKLPKEIRNLLPD